MTATITRPAIAAGTLVRIGPGYTETGLLATVTHVGADGTVELRLGLTGVAATIHDIQPAPDARRCAHCQVQDAVRGPYCGGQCQSNAEHVTEADWWRRTVERRAD
jgi:hypothetical protein